MRMSVAVVTAGIAGRTETEDGSMYRKRHRGIDLANSQFFETVSTMPNVFTFRTARVSSNVGNFPGPISPISILHGNGLTSIIQINIWFAKFWKLGPISISWSLRSNCAEMQSFAFFLLTFDELAEFERVFWSWKFFDCPLFPGFKITCRHYSPWNAEQWNACDFNFLGERFPAGTLYLFLQLWSIRAA